MCFQRAHFWIATVYEELDLPARAIGVITAANVVRIVFVTLTNRASPAFAHLHAGVHAVEKPAVDALERVTIELLT